MKRSLRQVVAQFAAAFAGSLLASTAAQAMGGLLLIDPPPAEQARLSFGGSLWSLHGPATQAPRNRTWLLPSAEYYAPNGMFASTDIGLGWNLSPLSDVQAGVRLSPLPSQATVNGQPARVGSRLEHGLFLNYAATDILLMQSSVRRGAGIGRQGVMAEVGATSGLPLPGHELLGLTAGASWANHAWRSSYVTSSTPPPAGWQDSQVALSHEHRLTSHWRLDTQWVLARPIHRRDTGTQGSPLQRQLSLGLWKDLD